MEIEGKYVPNEAQWQSINEQMFEIWCRLDRDEEKRIPVRPASHVFSDVNRVETTKAAQQELLEAWNKTLEWIDLNDCEMTDCGVVKIPHGKKCALKIDPENPYESDVLRRNKQAGDALIRLFEMQKEAFVLAINGAWGCGKTTFLDMWQHQLTASEYRIIRFNAWESDFADDPLISVLCEIQQKFGEPFKKKLEKTASEVTRVGLGLLLKVLTAGVVSKDDFDTSVFADGAEVKTSDLFDAYQSHKNSVANFKKMLSKAISESTATGSKPLVFIIDELDRCRPTYSIELLERIKHLFDIKEVIFVLALDKEQLGKSIQAVYGDINTEGYLRRFIDLTYNLPEPSPKEFITALLSEVHLTNYLESRTQDEGIMEWIIGGMTYWAPVMKLSLRDIEHVVRHLAFIVRTTLPHERLRPSLLILMLCLRFYKGEAYAQFMKGDLSAETLLEQLPSFPSTRVGFSGHRISHLSSAIFFVMDRNSGVAVGVRNTSLSEEVYRAIQELLSWNGCGRDKDDRIDVIKDVYKKIEACAAFAW